MADPRVGPGAHVFVAVIGEHCKPLVGSNPWFHLPQDRWPHAVDTAAITRIAAGAARLALALTC